QASANAPASCAIDPQSIVSRSSTGVAQVSNLALIYARAVVSPPRPVPAGGALLGLRVEATVRQIVPNGGRTIVTSTVNMTGGGGDLRSEYVTFTLDIPIDAAERDAAIRDYVESLERAAASSTNERERLQAAMLQRMGSSAFASMFRQHRVGRFQI